MEQISELITKKKKEENNKIKEILILKKGKVIILLYDNKLEFYKKTLQKYLEIIPEFEEPCTIQKMIEIKIEKDYIILALTTNNKKIKNI